MKCNVETHAGKPISRDADAKAVMLACMRSPYAVQLYVCLSTKLYRDWGEMTITSSGRCCRVCVCVRDSKLTTTVWPVQIHTLSLLSVLLLSPHANFILFFQINRLRFSANCESRACTQTHESEQQQQQRGLSSEPYLITSNWAILRIMINAFFFFFWFCWFFGFFAVECGLDNAPCNYIFNFVINTEIHCW